MKVGRTAHEEKLKMRSHTSNFLYQERIVIFINVHQQAFRRQHKRPQRFAATANVKSHTKTNKQPWPLGTNSLLAKEKCRDLGMDSFPAKAVPKNTPRHVHLFTTTTSPEWELCEEAFF